MVVRPRPGLFEILFTLQGSVLPEIAPKVLSVAALACISVGIERCAPELFPREGGIGPFTLIGLALSIFLSFRNTACYDRWWEARRAWGALIVEVRSLARLVPAPLVLHGGSGTPHDALESAIRLGITKINVNTEVALAGSAALLERGRRAGPVHAATLGLAAQQAMTASMLGYVRSIG
jgi:hypothetical protein